MSSRKLEALYCRVILSEIRYLEGVHILIIVKVSEKVAESETKRWCVRTNSTRYVQFNINRKLGNNAEAEEKQKQ